LARSEQKFEYLLFAGVCHHVDDRQCKQLLEAALRLMDPAAAVIVVDPVGPEPEDSWLLRREKELPRLLEDVPGLGLQEAQMHLVGATPMSVPKCARFGVYVLSGT